MNMMTQCTKCSHPLDPEDAYCRKCGTSVHTDTRCYESDDSIKAVRSSNLLSILILWVSFSSLFWVFLGKIMEKLVFGGDIYSSASDFRIVYDVFGWLFSLVSLGLGITLLILVRHRLGRIAMILYLVAQFVSLVVYRVIDPIMGSL